MRYPYRILEAKWKEGMSVLNGIAAEQKHGPPAKKKKQG
jgi:hypothetical protein